ncbi:MAG: hypothetical protein WCG50_13240 [Rhodoferax sp.]|uniref:hypothetical protein n=1 Tax=Rhodoferax sp. TaxID=50421 RepID=UPI003019781C
MQKNIELADFDSYFRFVGQLEWNQYWKLKSTSKIKVNRGSMILEATPLGDFIEVRNGSANQHVCSNKFAQIKKLQLAAELVRVEYYLKHNDLDSLIKEFVKSDSAIQQMMTRKPQSERFISFESFANAQGLARVVATRKAAIAALE